MTDYTTMCPNKDGNLWQNDTFHPLKIIHAGMPCFVNKGTWRTRQEAIPAIERFLEMSLSKLMLRP